jgi:hypothetical protein
MALDWKTNKKCLLRQRNLSRTLFHVCFVFFILPLEKLSAFYFFTIGNAPRLLHGKGCQVTIEKYNVGSARRGFFIYLVGKGWLVVGTSAIIICRLQVNSRILKKIDICNVRRQLDIKKNATLVHMLYDMI